MNRERREKARNFVIWILNFVIDLKKWLMFSCQINYKFKLQITKDSVSK